MALEWPQSSAECEHNEITQYLDSSLCPLVLGKAVCDIRHTHAQPTAGRERQSLELLNVRKLQPNSQ